MVYPAVELAFKEDVKSDVAAVTAIISYGHLPEPLTRRTSHAIMNIVQRFHDTGEGWRVRRASNRTMLERVTVKQIRVRKLNLRVNEIQNSEHAIPYDIASATPHLGTRLCRLGNTYQSSPRTFSVGSMPADSLFVRTVDQMRVDLIASWDIPPS